MCAIVSGMVVSGHKVFVVDVPFFTDCARGAIRLAPLMELPVIPIRTIDSIDVGKGGPTGAAPAKRAARHD
jgi:transketolase